MTYYASSKIQGRTAHHENGVLTVFQGLDIIATVDVPQDTYPATVWEHIHAAEVATAAATAPVAPKYPTWFTALLNEGRVMDRTQFERQAYRGYIAYELSMTDGHFAPETFDRWVRVFRKDPVEDLYRGNDSRHELAPYARAYAGKREYKAIRKLVRF